MELACASAAMEDCCRVCALARFEASAAILASLMEDSDAVRLVIWELASDGGVIDQVFARANRALHLAEVADSRLDQSQSGGCVGCGINCRNVDA